MNDQESIDNTQMVIDYQDSLFDRQNGPGALKETPVKPNPGVIQSSSSTKYQRSNPATTDRQGTSKRQYEVPPLILEGVNLSRVALNNFLVKKIPDLKCNNIVYNEKNRNFTIYSSTVASFNALLTRLALGELSDTAKIFIPRSIQRIQKTDTEAFVKNVDRELSIYDIQNALVRNGYQTNQVERLMNKDKSGPGTTIKITFGDVTYRDTFAKLGLQIDHMHFPAEKAKQKVLPQQCLSCHRFGHIARYCKQSHPNCSHCTGPHRFDVCDQKQQQPKCCNCQGSHQATSSECPKYKEEQKRLQSTVDRYSRSFTITHSPATAPNSNDLDEYPSMSSVSHINPQTHNSIIEACTTATTAAIERISEQLIAVFAKKLEELTGRNFATPRLPIDVTFDSISGEINSDLNDEERKRVNEGSIEISSNSDHQSTVDDGKSDICEANHTSNPHQIQQITMSKLNGMKRSSNINSPTSHQPKRTNTSEQRKTSQTRKSKNKTLVI